MAVYEKSATIKFPFMTMHALAEERERRQQRDVALIQIECYLESANGMISQKAKDKIRSLIREGMGQSTRSEQNG